MNNWQDWITELGGTWEKGTITGLPTNNMEHHHRLVPMSDHAVILVKGENAETFLQGQLTCDLRKIKQNEHFLGAHCNAKGRMISSMHVFALEENTIALRVRADLVAGAMQALQKYAVFSKVTLELSPLMGLALVPKETSTANEVFAELSAPNQATQTQTGCFVNHGSWLEVWTEPTNVDTLWASLAGNPAKPVTLNYFLIEQGIAEVHAATSEMFIPQMLNFELINGVSFDKGCYTGQEIVARLHYRGKTKTRTYRVACKNATVGDDIVSDAAPEKSVGTVVAASEASALIAISTELYEQQTKLHIHKDLTTILEWEPLPYAIP